MRPGQAGISLLCAPPQSRQRKPAGIVTMEDMVQLLTRELDDLAAGVLGARDREFEQRACQHFFESFLPAGPYY